MLAAGFLFLRPGRSGTVRRLVSVGIVVAAIILVGLGHGADEILTNDLVIKLVAAGFSEGVIIEKIQSLPSRFETDIESMIALKKAGVPEPVIQAMVRARRGSQVAAPDPLSPTQTTPAPGSSSPAGGTAVATPGIVQPPIGSFVRTPGVVGAALGSGLFPVFSPVPVEVNDTVIYIRDEKQIELDYTRGRVKQSGFVVYTTKLVMHDARAQLRVTEPRPTFFVGANPTDLLLVRFKSDPKDNDRTMTIGKAMFFPYWSDVKQYVDTDDSVPVDFEKLPSGYYRVTPKHALCPGSTGSSARAAVPGGRMTSGAIDGRGVAWSSDPR